MTLGTIRVADKVSVQQFPNGGNKLGTVTGVREGVIKVQCGSLTLEFDAVDGFEVGNKGGRKGHRLIAKFEEKEEYSENWSRRS